MGSSSDTSLTGQQIKLVQSSWKKVKAIKPEIVGDLFYGHLFAEMPMLKQLFRNTMHDQYRKFLDMLSLLVARLHKIGEITPEISSMAKRHKEYGVLPQHYTLVGDALFLTLAENLGPLWTPAMEDAWHKSYGILADIMIEASDYSN